MGVTNIFLKVYPLVVREECDGTAAYKLWYTCESHHVYVNTNRLSVAGRQHTIDHAALMAVQNDGGSPGTLHRVYGGVKKRGRKTRIDGSKYSKSLFD